MTMEDSLINISNNIHNTCIDLSKILDENIDIDYTQDIIELKYIYDELKNIEEKIEIIIKK